MEKSTSIASLAKALVLFHSKIGKIKKDANNPFFKSKYASLGNILDCIDPVLQECGLALSQFPVGVNGLVTILIHAESGEYMQAEYEMRPQKDDPQGRGSAITYQRRYATGSVLNLNIDEDDDGNRASQQQPITNNGQTLPWLNEGSRHFNGAVAKLKAGQTTIEKIKTVYSVSKSVENKLLEQSKA